MEHDTTNWVLITKDNYLTLQPGESIKSFEPGKESKIQQLKDSHILSGEVTMQNGVVHNLLKDGIYVYREPEVFNVNKYFDIRYHLSSLDGKETSNRYDSEEEALERVATTEGSFFRYFEFKIVKTYRFKK